MISKYVTPGQLQRSHRFSSGISRARALRVTTAVMETRLIWERSSASPASAAAGRGKKTPMAPAAT